MCKKIKGVKYNVRNNKNHIGKVMGIMTDYADYVPTRRDVQLVNRMVGSWSGQRSHGYRYRPATKSWKERTRNKRQWCVHKKHCKYTGTGQDYAQELVSEGIGDDD